MELAKNLISKAKDSSLNTHVKIWFCDHGVKNGNPQISIIPIYFSVVEGLSLLDKKVFLESITTAIKYFLIVMEFSKNLPDGKSKYVKKFNSIILQLIAILLKREDPSSPTINTPAESILQKKCIAEIFKYICLLSQISHSATLELYKSSFISAATNKNIIPIEKLKQYTVENEENLIKLLYPNADSLYGASINIMEDCISIKKALEENKGILKSIVEKVTKERIMYLAEKSPDNQNSRLLFFK